MMDKNEKPDHVETIKQQIEEVLKEIANLKNRTSKILNAAELEKFEKDIARKTDRLAGLLTVKAIQESLDSDEMKQKSSELIKSMPQRMESQGLRDVKIKPARGGAVTVKAAYYTPKKKRKRKKKNPERRSVSRAFHVWHLRLSYSGSGIRDLFDCHHCSFVSGSKPSHAGSGCGYRRQESM
jgi:regulator of replication initiation timing